MGDQPRVDQPDQTASSSMDVDPAADQSNSVPVTSATAPTFSVDIRVTRHTAYAPISSFAPLNLSLAALRNKLTSIVNVLPGFLVVKLGNNRETKGHILVDFNSSNGFDTFLATSHKDLCDVQFTEYVPKRISSPEIDRQLHLKHIPLFIKKHDLESYFENVGKVERINMRTTDGYESATVTFESPSSLDSFQSDLWMIFVQGHAIQATPANLTAEARALRVEHVALLSGFRSNICAGDLLPFIQDFKVKCIFIPRQSYKYFQRPWAYVTFESDQMLQHAMEHDQLGVNGSPLFWSPRTDSNKICLHCGHTAHLYKDCPNRRSRAPKKVISES